MNLDFPDSSRWLANELSGISQSLPHTKPPMMLGIQLCARDLNSGHHAYKAITWQTETSSGLSLVLYLRNDIVVRICQPTDIGLFSYEVSVVTRVIVKLRNPLLLLYSFSHAQVVLVIVCSLNSCERCYMTTFLNPQNINYLRLWMKLAIVWDFSLPHF